MHLTPELDLAFAYNVKICVRLITFSHYNLLKYAILLPEMLFTILHVEPRVYCFHLREVLMEKDNSLLLPILDILSYDQLKGFRVHREQNGRQFIVKSDCR